MRWGVDLMLYEELQVELLKLLQRRGAWDRVVAFDIETSTRDRRFFSGERVLSVTLARRSSGKLKNDEGIELKTLFLEEETDEAEIKLLKCLNEALEEIKPLCLIGYGIRQYDIPLLVIKKQQYGERYKQLYGQLPWKLIDALESALHIDLYHILKYKGYKKFDQVFSSEEFRHLPLRRTKKGLPSDKVEKGERIYRLWKENKEKLKEYTEGEVHDILLIAEELVLRGEGS